MFINLREIEMKECLEINPEMGLGDTDSTSVYFTPSGTPMRDLSSLKGTPQREFNEMYGGVYSPTRGDGSPEKGGGKGRGHRRMVSNLSNFLPFWWGMNQGTGEEPMNEIFNMKITAELRFCGGLAAVFSGI